MKKSIRWIIFLIFVSPFPFGTTMLQALDVDTHKKINLRIAESDMNGFVLNSVLKSQLGFKEGIVQIVDNNTIEEWLKLGGYYEDKPPWAIVPYIRSFNHYHEPITNSGFSGFFDGSPLSGSSSASWAQLPIGTQSPGGYFSWPDVRDYYYKALTSIDKTQQEKLYAQTFRGLGQLMHLVTDASVPSHTRNDPHFWDYEAWVKNNPGVIQVDSISYNKSILSRINAKLPIQNIFDTDQYDGTNPEVTAGTSIGLAEYSSANFLSEHTINSAQFPYPKLDSRSIVERTYLSISGDPYIRKYYFKNCCGETNSGKGYLLSAMDYFDYWRQKSSVFNILPVIPVLDDNVYNDYASLLLPRAIGYSAGLLQYFFRGNLGVTSVPIFYDDILYFIKLKIKNLTPDETMANGGFVLTYRYTPTGGPTDGSKDIFGQAWGLDGSAIVPCTQLKGATKKADGTMDWGEMEAFFMIYPAMPREDYDSIKFTLAFQGTLGDEQGKAVIGKSFRLGEIIFDEEWDNGLDGNHSWGHTGFNLDNSNPPNGVTKNNVGSDYLVKENLRYQGNRSGRFNQSVLCDICGGGQYKDILLPLPITRNTYLVYKIDEMSVTPSDAPGSGQYLMLSFTNKLALEISQSGQMVEWNATTAYYTFPLGMIVVDNIYDMFQRVGITVPEPFYLNMIDFSQLLYELDNPSNADHSQRMKVDLIQIVEGKEY